MRAELEDGSIVELERDCDCITHDDPHWLHMDRIRYRQNLRVAYYAYAFVRVEERRLRLKREEMERRGIVRLIDDPVPQNSTDAKVIGE